MGSNTNNAEKIKDELIHIFLPDKTIMQEMARLLTLVSTIGTMLTLACSAYRVHRFSVYFGIPVSNISFLSTGKDLFVILCLPLAIIFFMRLVFWSGLKLFLREGIVKLEDAIKAICFLFATLAEAICFWTYYRTSISGTKDEFDYIAISCCLLLVGIVLSVRLYSMFKKDLFNYMMCAAIIIISVIIVLTTSFMSALRIQDFCLPENETNYETLYIDDQQFVVICGSDEVKLILKCESKDDGETLDIYRGEYQYITTTGYSYDYHSYRNVFLK